MKRIRTLMILALAVALPALLPFKADAQAPYPNKPVKIVVTFPPGGASDIATRLVAAEWSNTFGQPFVIENIVGASGLVGWEAFRREKPDGYSLILASNAVSAAPHMLLAAKPDIINAFQSVALFVEGPMMVLVPKDSPAKTFPELVTYVKANPGKLNTGVSGGTVELDTILLMYMAGMKMQPIQYKGAAQASMALAQGDIHFLLGGPASTKSYLASGAVRILAIASDKPWTERPELPIIGKQMLPGYFAAGPFFGFSGPKGLPREVVQKMQTTLRPATQSPELRRRLAEMGMYISEDQSAEELDRIIKSLYNHYGEAAKIAGVKPE